MQPARLLIVDDEEPFVAAMSRRLTRRGYVVADASDGRSALNVLKNDASVEVVVLDVKMPVMDGIETLQAIRRFHPLVEVIMLTGHATVESAIEGMKLGAFDYLMKPCDMDTLVKKVDDAIARKRAQEERIAEARIREITLRRT